MTPSLRRPLRYATLAILLSSCGQAPTRGVDGSSEIDAPAAVASSSVLFIGNSYTYVNDLPGMLEQLTASTQQPLYQESVTAAGATLEDHFSGGAGESVLRIASRRWSYVILQEQSTRPLDDPALFFQSVRLFDAKIHEAGAQTLLYLTWPHQNQPEQQATLTDAYQTIARELSARLLPVGPAWAIAEQNHLALNLYQPDQSHPTAIGSYLAALVIYGKLLAQPPGHLAGVVEQNGFLVVNLEGDPESKGILAAAAVEAIQTTPP